MMLPDFPDAKKDIKKTIDALLRQQVKQKAPMLSMINKRTLYEGDKLGVVHSDGKHVVTDLMYAQSEFSITKEEATTMETDEIIAKVSTAAEDMAGQIERGLFKKMDESITESGNVISGNPELTPDSVLTALEMIAVDFEDDDRAKPVKPSLIAHPDTVEKLMALDAKTTPEEKELRNKKEVAIMDKKYEQYMEDLHSRKIVD